MSVKLSTRQVGDVTVMDVAGPHHPRRRVQRAARHPARLVGKGQKKILLNLGDVSYIDSSGIGELVSGFTTVTNSGGQLKLLNLTKRVKDLLQITKLYTVFDVHEDEASPSAASRRSGVRPIGAGRSDASRRGSYRRPRIGGGSVLSAAHELHDLHLRAGSRAPCRPTAPASRCGDPVPPPRARDPVQSLATVQERLPSGPRCASRHSRLSGFPSSVDTPVLQPL